MTEKKRSMFISYSHFDRTQCDRIANAIDKTNQFEIWYDKGLIPGEVYRKKIAETLKGTDIQCTKASRLLDISMN